MFQVGAGQAGGCVVDYDNPAFNNVFCEPTWDPTLRGYVAFQNGGQYPEGTYTVKAEILVDGGSGNKGAYFRGNVAAINFIENQSELMDPAAPAIVRATATNPKAYTASGTEITGNIAYSGCTPADDVKAVTVVSETAINAVAAADTLGRPFMRVDIPPIGLVKEELPANAKISVKISVYRGCNDIGSAEFGPLFTVVDECPADGESVTTPGKLLLPYFADASYWNGLALTNTGTSDVIATLTVVDQDGGKGTIDVTVPAEGMYVNFVSAIVSDSSFSGSVDPAKRCYIEVKPQTGRLQAFVMMGNLYGHESMGYVVD
jgi:hypothetical protein